MTIRNKTLTTVLSVTALLSVLCACAPDPFGEPTPPPSPSSMVTGFASDEEAFAAAEATYRAYVDAVNEVDLSDPATFEPLFRLTTEDANRSARDEFAQMHRDQWFVSGDTKVTLIKRHPASTRDLVQLMVCIDVSSVKVQDARGKSVVSSDRADFQSLAVSLVDAQDGNWLISALDPREGEPTCA